MKLAVTGGAGFIGSHLTEKLLENHEVVVLDNLSSGKKDLVPEKAEFVEVDVKNRERLETVLEEIEAVFHLAANPKVNTFPEDREKDFEENLEGTKSVLDACKKSNVEQLVFASSSVVYGEECEIPTPETANFDPISMYGATKAGGEHMCQVYQQILDLDVTIVRLANIVGGRAEKGVTYDFVQKLKENPEELEILGDGRQKKSYIHVEDTVEGIIAAWTSEETVFNIGNEDAIDVTRIAEVVSDEMSLEPDFSYTGGRKGWDGDVPEMRLEIEKLKEEGWRPSKSSEQAIRETVKKLK